MRGLGKDYGMGPRYPVVPRFACVRFHILCLKKHQKIFSFDICIFTGTVAGRVNGGKFRCPTKHALQSFEWSYDPAHWKLDFVIEDTYTCTLHNKIHIFDQKVCEGDQAPGEASLLNIWKMERRFSTILNPGSVLQMILILRCFFLGPKRILRCVLVEKLIKSR